MDPVVKTEPLEAPSIETGGGSFLITMKEEILDDPSERADFDMFSPSLSFKEEPAIPESELPNINMVNSGDMLHHSRCKWSSSTKKLSHSESDSFQLQMGSIMSGVNDEECLVNDASPLFEFVSVRSEQDLNRHKSDSFDSTTTLCDPNHSELSRKDFTFPEKIPSSGSTLLCCLCRRSASDKAALIEHMITHVSYRIFSCPQCNYSTTRKQSLVSHMRRHTGERPFKCSQCEYSAGSKGNLKTHSRTHTGEKPYSCSQCNFLTSHKATLIQHMRKHTGEKPYECSLCHYSTSHNSSLIVHMRTHSRKKPFACSQCDYHASRKKYLKEHMGKHFREKSFVCDECRFCTSRKPALIQHMKRHRNKEIEKL